MKIERKEITNGIVRITTEDERWYLVDDQYIPSVTWISSFYPKGVAFYKWLADKGWDESQALKEAAGARGSKVHKAIEDLIARKTVKHDAQYLNTSTEKIEELTAQEYGALLSFADWHKETDPIPLHSELIVISKLYNFAGTADFICKIGEETWLIDFKTSSSIWPEYELQMSAYKQALQEQGILIDKMGILQVGYTRNKSNYKFTEIEDKFPLFEAAKAIWANETAGQTVLQKDFPIEIKLEDK